MLPYEFRKLGMGKIIGTRTWGGLVGVSQFIPLIDGGVLTAPDYRIYDPEGNWIIENEGVTPNIRIELDSEKMSEGKDVQLRKAIEEVMDEIDKNPVKWPEHKPFLEDKQAN
jgi:tricorn protease